MSRNEYGSGMLMLMLIVGISVIMLGFGIWYAWSSGVEKAKQEVICKRFCESLSSLGFSYDKVGYDDIRGDYVCYCKRKQTIYVNGTDYLVEYTLPYGHIYNFTVLNETNTTT